MVHLPDIGIKLLWKLLQGQGTTCMTFLLAKALKGKPMQAATIQNIKTK